VTAPATTTAAPDEAPEESLPSQDDDAWRRRWPPMSYWVRVVLTVAAVGVILLALWVVRNIVVLVLISAVLAIGLDPAVRAIERRGQTRGRAVAAISLGAIAFAILFFSLVIPPLVSQIDDLAAGVPGYVDRLAARDDAIGRYVRDNDVAERLQEFVKDLPDKITNSFGTIVGVAGKVGSLIFNVVTVAILTIYFMFALPRIRGTAAIVFAPSIRERGEDVLDQAISRIGGYVAGILTTATIAGISAITFFAILAAFGVGIPFSIPLAVWASVCGLIPAVGAYIGAAPAVAVGFFQSGLTGILVLAYFIVYQQIENYAIQPRIMKNAVNLSPAAVIISTLVFGSLAGFAGAVLALPAAATIKVLIVEVFLRSRVEEGDAAAREKLEEHEEAEAEAEAEAVQRAKTRERWLRTLRERLTGNRHE
jgi:predicted PurR-regulated permease PerM